MLSNIPLEYANKEKLNRWLKSLKIGEIESIHMNTIENEDVIEAVDKYHQTLKRLEKAYMEWAINLHQYLKHGTLISSFFVGPNLRYRLAEKIMPDADLAKCTPEILSATRPRILNAKLIPIDSIGKYIQDLSDTKLDIEGKRLKSEGGRTNQGQEMYATSAFVTFKCPRSAYYSLQLQLYSGLDGYSMNVKDVPIPSEIIWNNLTKPFVDKYAVRIIISIITFILTLLWVIPSYFVAGLSVLGIPSTTTSNILILNVLKFVFPPLIIAIIAGIMPQILHGAII